MENSREVIPVFFSVDDNYAPYLSVALNSMIRNASRAYQYKMTVLYQKLSAENRKKLAKLATEYADIEFVPMEDRLGAITDRMSNRLRCDYFTLTIYFRLFIPAMFPQYDKGIYVDSDIVVPGDISELYRVELGDNLIGASRDYSIQKMPQLIKYMDEGVGVGRTQYINSGVLLMNLKKLREAEIDKRFLELLTTYHFDTIAPDQDYLNAMCHGKIVYLDECWDAMPKENEPALAEPKLIHYNLFSKPWCYEGIQYEEYFWNYAKDAGYLDEICEYKKNYSEEQKKSDRECLALLLRRAEEIAGMEENFCTVFASGRERRLA